ncbi:MAG: DASH family cryptochrome [Steroidobacteraceae bacterium]
MKTIIVWFRNDLRVRDNRVLREAAAQADRLLYVYLHDPRHDLPTRWGFPRMGRHRRLFLADTLRDLEASLAQRGHTLWVSRARPAEILPALVKASNATAVFCEQIGVPEEERDVAEIRAVGIEVETVWQSSLLEPSDLPFEVASLPQIFTVFRKQIEARAIVPHPPLPAPDTLPEPAEGPFESLMGATAIEHILSAEPVTLDVRSSFPYTQPACRGGESAALAHLEHYFSTDAAQRYKQTRNGLAGLDYSTKFSPWLATGAISPRTVYAALKTHESTRGANESTYWIWFELLWRDYFRFLHLQHGRRLYRAAGLHDAPAPPHDETRFEAWCKGRSGEAFNDAGLRELEATGYLSNRLRQNVASWLINDLRCDFRAGAAWFESQLVDYDPYSNQGNWLYLAGRGTDPREGRRFDPERQARMYDADGAYRLLWNRPA